MVGIGSSSSGSETISSLRLLKVYKAGIEMSSGDSACVFTLLILFLGSWLISVAIEAMRN